MTIFYRYEISYPGLLVISAHRGQCSPLQGLHQTVRFPLNLEDLNCFIGGASG